MSAATGLHVSIAPYQQSIDDVIAELETDQQSGVSNSEVQRRLGLYGRNELAAERPAPAWRKFLAQFSDTLVILLLVAAAISAALWLYERDRRRPTKRWRFSASRCSMPSLAVHSKRGSKPRWRRYVPKEIAGQGDRRDARVDDDDLGRPGIAELSMPKAFLLAAPTLTMQSGPL